MKPERLRALLLVAIMAAVALAVAAVALVALYRSNLETQRSRLIDLVAARESLVDAVYQASGDRQVTLEILAEAQREAPGLGTTGEFAVGRSDGGTITFLVPLRYPVPGDRPLKMAGATLAQPMARALAGEHGTMIGRDYRGETVLAAYSPVDGPDWGLVAKMDLAEVRAPIVRAGGFALLGTLVLVALGALVFIRVTSPMLRLMEESEQRYRAVFEHSRVGKSLTAPDGRLLQVNRAFAEMLGYTVAELQQLDFARVTHPDDIAESRECIRCLIAGERDSYHMEKRYLHRDGHIVWTDVNTSLLRDGSGSPLYFITTVTDVSDRERARRDLLAEKHFSEAMLASLPGVAYLFDETLRFERWNNNFEQVTGYSSDELAELTPLELFEGADQARVAERIGEVFATGESSVEADVVAKDGTRTPYLFTGRMAEIGEQTFLVGMGVDITERRRMEAELQALNADLERRVEERAHQLKLTHERLRFVVGASPAMIATRRPTGGFEPTSVTENVVAVLGHRPEELTSDPRFWIDHVHPKDRVRVLDELATLHERDQLVHDYRFRRADGAYRWLHAEAQLVRDSDGRPLEIVNTWLDITDRMAAEEKISELNDDLARSVEHLAAANKELEAFSYSVSHDLRAPLRAIDGFSRILLDEHAAELDPEAQRYLKIVRDNTKNMALLIDDLLAFSRLSRQAMHTEPVRLAGLVAEAWDQLEPERNDRRVELAVGRLPIVSGDPHLLKQVLLNLLGNAIKFTRTREDARIEVGVQVLNGDTVVFVRDNGVGFDMRYKDKLFGVFQRLHRADEFEGTGVGLATVARIVHRHGGRVWAEAEPGSGATFFLSFNGGTDGAEQTD